MVVTTALVVPAAAASAATTALVSMNTREGRANKESGPAMISADGRFVAFASLATNLSTMPDTNRRSDIFVRDLVRGTTRRVSVSSSGAQADGASRLRPTISGDGRYVAFTSDATNLVPHDQNRGGDVFVRDRVAKTTRIVDRSSTGAQANFGAGFGVISRDGRFVAFVSDSTNLVANDTNRRDDVFVRDLVAGTTGRVSLSTAGKQARGESFADSISAHGRFVLFTSTATNLVPGDTNGHSDLFVRDRREGTTRRVDVSTEGAQANADSFSASLSANGRFAVFDTAATNLVPDDTNGVFDIFLRDLVRNRTVRVSVPRSGAQANGGSEVARVSPDGRYVTFLSDATNFDPADTNHGEDAYLRDRVANTTELISRATSGARANHASVGTTLSDDARAVEFESDATNLDPRADAIRVQVYVRLR